MNTQGEKMDLTPPYFVIKMWKTVSLITYQKEA